MTTLTEFLLARIGEDEAVASALGNWRLLEAPIYHLFDDDPEVQGDIDAKDYAKTFAQFLVARGIPARVLAECAAHKAIVDEYLAHLRHIESRGSLPSGAIERDARVLRGALTHLAGIYADHPDYRAEWAL